MPVIRVFKVELIRRLGVAVARHPNDLLFWERYPVPVFDQIPVFDTPTIDPGIASPFFASFHFPFGK